MQTNSFYITSSQTWTVPNDWSNVNKIQVVGGGGGGGKGQYYVYDLGGARLVTYALGGAGGGYAEVTNLQSLKPGQQISIVVGSGGGAGSNYGGEGGTTNFGGLILGTGATVGSGTYPPHYGGYGIVNLTSGFGSSLTRAGESRFYSNNQLQDIPGGSGGGNFVGGLGGGGGGRGEKLGTGAWPAASGSPGAVLITYTPSGTHQACVWIS